MDRLSDLKLCLQGDDRDEKRKGSAQRRWVTIKTWLSTGREDRWRRSLRGGVFEARSCEEDG